MTPIMRPGEAPPFFQLDGIEFQHMCREVLAYEPGASKCEEWGVPGQRQEGVDLVLYPAMGSKIVVAQCKCQKEITPSNIREASQEFSKHLAAWKGKGAKRFILIVASSLTRTELQEEVLSQTSEFKKRGLKFEAWSALTLRDKLRSHADIVRQYCSHPPGFWVAAICGEQYSPPYGLPSTAGSVGAVQPMDLERIASLLSADVDSRLDDVKRMLMEGRRTEVESLLGSLRGETSRWLVLPMKTQARVLRTEARLAITEAGGLERAGELAKEARGKDPTAPMDLEALIALHASGPQEALLVLGEANGTGSLNLKAGLLLELDRTDEAFAVLAGQPETGDDAVETLRLRALAHLARGDTSQALSSAQKAHDLKPTWVAIAETLGRVEFYLAVSQAAQPDHLEPWPAPVPWGLVRKDDESVSRLRAASARFLRMLDSPGIPCDRRSVIEYWYFACLACDQEHQSEAQERAKGLLGADPTAQPVLFWAGARRYDVDWERSARALRKRLESVGASVSDCLALAQCRLSAGMFDRGLKELRDHRALFRSAGQEPLWVHWSVQLLLAGGRKGAAGNLIKREATVGDISSAREAVLRARGKKSELIRLLGGEDGRTAEGSALAEICSLHGSSGNWAFVAEHADELVRKVGTAEAVRLACIGLLRNHNLEQCMTLLEKAPAYFPRSVLPPDLVVVRVECESALGLLPDAIKHAEELTREHESVENLLNLARLHLLAADARSAADVALRLHKRTDLKPTDALGLAEAVRNEDAETARLLWRQALTGGDLPDEVFVWAYTLAFPLGLEVELQGLSDRFARIAETRPELLRTISLDGLVAELQRHHRQSTKVEEALLSGTIPGHFGLPLLGMSLPKLYRFPSISDLPGDLLRNFVLARHGSRTTLSEPLPESPKRFIVDLTALLSAAELGCLDAVETQFGPLWITDGLVPALHHCREQLGPRQPERLRAFQALITLVDSGKIQVLERSVYTEAPGATTERKQVERLRALVGKAVELNGIVVDYLPLERSAHGTVPPELADSIRPYLLNCRGVLDALSSAGALSQASYRKARRALGHEGEIEAPGVLLTPGTHIILSGNIAEVLAGADLLHSASETFHVLVEPDEADRVRAELRDSREAEAVASTVDHLIEHLRVGIKSGRFRALPSVRVAPVPKSRGSKSLEMVALQGVLGGSHEQGSVFWCDDRFLSAYDNANGALVVTTVGVLEALRVRGKLARPDFFEALLRLRAGNMRFVPLDRDELLYHLRNASLVGSEISETRELSIERRYFTACLVDGGILQRVGACPNRARTYGEMPFLTASLTAIRLAILEAWRTPDVPLARREAESAWLADLIPDYLPFAPIAETGDTQFLALTLAGLLVQAMQLDSARRGVRTATRAQYLEWVDRVLLGPALRRDSLLIVAVTDKAKRLLRQRPSRSAKKAERLVASKIVGDLVCDFPKAVREEIFKDQSFAEFHQLRTVSLIQVADYSFEEKEFYSAAESVAAGTPAVIKDQGSERILSLVFEPSEGPTCLRLVRGDEEYRLADEAFCVLLPGVAEREKRLRSRPEWIDVSGDERDRIIAGIVTQVDPATRVEMVRAWMRQSEALYYQRLQAEAQSGRTMSLTDFLPPSPASVLRRTRTTIRAGDPLAFSASRATGAASLLEEVGVAETARRFSAFPAPLPDEVLACFDRATPAERESAIAACSADYCSPVSLLHAAALALRDASLRKERDATKEVAKFLSRVADPSAVAAFKAVLGWVHAWGCEVAEMLQWPAGYRLAVAYSHADGIWTALRMAGAPVDKIEEYFERAQGNHLLELVTRDRGTWQDVAHPRRISSEALFSRGLLYVAEYGLLVDDGPAGEHLVSSLEPESLAALAPVNALCSDSMGSFLAWERPDLLQRLFGKDSAKAIQGPRTAALNSALGLLDRDPTDKEGWGTIAQVLGDLRPDGAVRERLSRALSRLDLSAPVGRTLDDDLLVLMAASRQAANCNVLSRENVAKQIGHLARRLEGTEGDVYNKEAAEKDTRLTLLLDACLSAAIDSEGPGSVAKRFSQIVEQTVNAAPSLAVRARAVFEVLCGRLPISTSKHLWMLLLRLRATTPPPQWAGLA